MTSGAWIESPFAPGESPFRIKGVAYRGTLEFYDKLIPGGRAAFIEALPDPLRGFFRQSFMASSLYDVFPLAVSGATGARLSQRSPRDLVLAAARHQAEYDLRGIYKVFLRAFNPPQIMEKMARVTAQYFDFAQDIQVRRVETTHAQLFRPAFPQPLLAWYDPVAGGYLEVAVARTGVTNVTTEVVAVATGRTSHGVPLVDITFNVRWQAR